MPSMEKLECLRCDKETYTLFMEAFVSCIVGRETFRKNALSEMCSNFVLVGDESMAMLILKNNYNLWKQMGDKMIESGNTNVVPSMKQCDVPQVFFDEKKGRGKSWNREGIEYHNAMYHKIIEDRKQNGRKFDEEYLNSKQDAEAIAKEQAREKRRPKVMVEAPAVKCITDYDTLFRTMVQEEEREQGVLTGMSSTGLIQLQDNLHTIGM